MRSVFSRSLTLTTAPWLSPRGLRRVPLLRGAPTPLDVLRRARRRCSLWHLCFCCSSVALTLTRPRSRADAPTAPPIFPPSFQNAGEPKNLRIPDGQRSIDLHQMQLSEPRAKMTMVALLRSSTRAGRLQRRGRGKEGVASRSLRSEGGARRRERRHEVARGAERDDVETGRGGEKLIKWSISRSCDQPVQGRVRAGPDHPNGQVRGPGRDRPLRPLPHVHEEQRIAVTRVV